jgi:hypothetical protein
VSYTSIYTQKKKNQNEDIDNHNFYDKRNEIIFWCSLYVGSCFVLNDNYCCMCCHCQSMLHQIYTSRIDNDNVYQGSKSIFGDDNIH